MYTPDLVQLYRFEYNKFEKWSEWALFRICISDNYWFVKYAHNQSWFTKSTKRAVI